MVHFHTRTEIAPIESALLMARNAILERIHNDYTTALGRERLLKADYAAQSVIVTDQAEKSIQYNILRREVDSNRQLYESMFDQVRHASVAAAIRASNIRIVDPAKMPRRPYSPGPSLAPLKGRRGNFANHLPPRSAVLQPIAEPDRAALQHLAADQRH